MEKVKLKMAHREGSDAGNLTPMFHCLINDSRQCSAAYAVVRSLV